ncbi:MAG: DUF262 domain-containing protein [Gemmatales bacterium]|nr:DUF262 domain-containing protein [Gemmatales bacterium]MDW8176671.1 DUF262 domain-containing protein [Gemmatales bacterium]
MPQLTSVILKANPWKVVDLATLKKEGKIHLPDLQRGFVWTAERVRALFDSLHRKYPIGALLFWRPKWEGESVPFSTRPWEVFPPDPQSGRGVLEQLQPVVSGSLFVLDGQQRLTSLFRVIFRSRIKDRTTPDPNLLVALSPEEEWVNDPFHLRSRGLYRKMRDGLLVPAEVLFEGLRGGNESFAIRQAIGEWVKPADDLFYQALDRANAIRTSILQAEIIAYEIDADADDDNVIEIFARLNQQGVRLRPADLAAARLTGHMTQFRNKARAIMQDPKLAEFAVPEGREEGPRSGGFVDTDLLMRACLFLGTGMVRYRDVEKRGDRGTYEKVEPHWDAAAKRFQAVVSLFRKAGVPSGHWLPYRHLLVPPAIAAAKGYELTDKWLAWAILASLWRHYAGEVETKLQRDCNLANTNDVDGLVEHVKNRAKKVGSALPEQEDFEQGIVSEGGVLLAFLVHFGRHQARSFPSGKIITAATEPLEVQHLFPRSLLNSFENRDNRYIPDRLGNLTIITRSDNEHLGDAHPKEYLTHSDPETRQAHLIPEERELWTEARYPEFCQAREKKLAEAVRELLNNLLQAS